MEVPKNKDKDPTKATLWETVTAPSEITDYLIERNRKKFGQAKGTPFTVPPLSTKLDFKASTFKMELILNREFNQDKLDDITPLFIEHLT